LGGEQIDRHAIALSSRDTPSRMVDQAGSGALPLDCHGERGDGEFGTHVLAHGPTHHLAGRQVEDHGQVEPALAGRNVGDIDQPDFIGLIGDKILLEQVCRQRQIMLAVGCAHAIAVDAPASVAFRGVNNVSTRVYDAFAAQRLAYTAPLPTLRSHPHGGLRTDWRRRGLLLLSVADCRHDPRPLSGLEDDDDLIRFDAIEVEPDKFLPPALWDSIIGAPHPSAYSLTQV
jgi:hypothetical protein